MPSALAACCFRTAEASDYPSDRFPGRESKRLSRGCSLKSHRIGRDGGLGKSAWSALHMGLSSQDAGLSADPHEPVERPLQDEGGGVLVDDGRALGPAHVGGDQVTLHRGGG
jgi:hypothetical protein